MQVLCASMSTTLCHNLHLAIPQRVGLTLTELGISITIYFVIKVCEANLVVLHNLTMFVGLDKGVEVTFAFPDPEVYPPDPRYLAFHAAAAKVQVVHMTGMLLYLGRVELYDKSSGTFSSVVELIEQCGPLGCTSRSQVTVFTYNIYDTAGLNEGESSRVPNTDAIVQFSNACMRE